MPSYIVNLDALYSFVVEARSAKEAEEKVARAVPGLQMDTTVIQDSECHRWEFFDTHKVELE